MRHFFCALFLAPVILVTGAVAAQPAPLRQAVATTAAAPTGTPEERIAAAERQFAAAASDPARLVALYRVQELGVWLAPQPLLATLQELAATPGLSPLLRAEVQAQIAAAQLRLGHPEATATIWRDLGAIENWQAIGPFDNASPAAIATAVGPENGVHLDAHYAGKQRQVGWRALPFNPSFGELDLFADFSPAQSASAYVVSWVRAERAEAVALHLRDSGATRLWVNGQLLFDEQGVHSSAGFDQHAVGAQLVAGWNEILAKVGNSESNDWRFSARLTTPEGEPLQLESSASAHPRPAPAAASAPAATAADLTAEAKAAVAGGGAAALANYAWILTHKKNFNAGDHLDTDTFMAAVAAAPADVQLQLDFIEHDSDPSRRYRNLNLLLAQAPGNPQALADRGGIELDRAEYWPARDDLAAALGATPATTIPAAAALQRQPRAALGMLAVYAGLGIRPSVMAWASALDQAGLTTAAIAAPVASLLQRLGANPDAMVWLQRAHASDAGNVEVSLQLADAQRRAGDAAAALATTQQALALSGEIPTLYELEARSYAGLQRGPEALAAMQKALALNPDDPNLQVAAGELQSQLGHAGAALQDWQAALALNPQDASLRDRLQLVRGGGAATAEASFEKPYAVDVHQAIADYKTEANAANESGPVVVLADTNVTNIFPSGNNGRYVQQIFRINNSSGADSLASYSVTYDPGTEDVHYLVARVYHPDGSSADAPEAGDQAVSESVGYETFYNVRNKYVQMPAMRPGDFVEIAYRVLPTTLESLYGDYFGDLTPFGGGAATLLQQYIVITPANKPLYYKAVRFSGDATQTEAGGQKIYRWTARHLPAFIGEPSAPPSIEQMPYVAVSSFQTWDQFGAWYSQLIRDTFVMDDEMVQTVQSLIQGKTTVEDKTDAIYRWVIQNTHYVALEFGIHGYRPYPVTQVFHRRFGDCKDKASLLIAMLHQAGIEAQFVLVRTRDRGVIDATIPSVADFDHAIAYVPSLKRYLDGTAEYEGARELPGGDQRAFVLRLPVVALNPEPGKTLAAALAGVAPEVTPEQPASANAVTRQLNGQIDLDGNLQFHLTWTLTGGRAPEFRQALELPDRQAGVVQAMLHDQLPGITVSRVTVQNSNDWDEPITLQVDGIIPRFATVNGNRMLIPRQFLPTSWLPQMAALATRRYPVLTDPPQQLSETMTLTLPPGFQATLPAATSLQQPFATFQAAVNNSPHGLNLSWQLETLQALIPPADYGAFRQFWSSVDAALGRPVSTTAGSGGGQ